MLYTAVAGAVSRLTSIGFYIRLLIIDSDLIIFPSIAKRCRTRQFFEGFIEMGDMLKPGLLSYKLNCISAIDQSFLGFTNTNNEYIFSKMKSSKAFENAAKIRRTNIELLSDLLQSNFHSVIVINILSDFGHPMMHRVFIVLSIFRLR